MWLSAFLIIQYSESAPIRLADNSVAVQTAVFIRILHDMQKSIHEISERSIFDVVFQFIVSCILLDIVRDHLFCHPEVNVFCQGKALYFVNESMKNELPSLLGDGSFSYKGADVFGKSLSRTIYDCRFPRCKYNTTDHECTPVTSFSSTTSYIGGADRFLDRQE